jgi:hypothetical protein
LAWLATVGLAAKSGSLAEKIWPTKNRPLGGRLDNQVSLTSGDLIQ